MFTIERATGDTREVIEADGYTININAMPQESLNFITSLATGGVGGYINWTTYNSMDVARISELISIATPSITKCFTSGVMYLIDSEKETFKDLVPPFALDNFSGIVGYADIDGAGYSGTSELRGTQNLGESNAKFGRSRYYGKITVDFPTHAGNGKFDKVIFCQHSISKLTGQNGLPSFHCNIFTPRLTELVATIDYSKYLCGSGNPSAFHYIDVAISKNHIFSKITITTSSSCNYAVLNVTNMTTGESKNYTGAELNYFGTGTAFNQNHGVLNIGDDVYICNRYYTSFSSYSGSSYSKILIDETTGEISLEAPIKGPDLVDFASMFPLQSSGSGVILQGIDMGNVMLYSFMTGSLAYLVFIDKATGTFIKKESIPGSFSTMNVMKNIAKFTNGTDTFYCIGNTIIDNELNVVTHESNFLDNKNPIDIQRLYMIKYRIGDGKNYFFASTHANLFSTVSESYNYVKNCEVFEYSQTYKPPIEIILQEPVYKNNTQTLKLTFDLDITI